MRLGIQSEATISASIASYLTRLGIYNDRLNSGKVNVTNRYEHNHFVQLCRKGTPDRIAIYKGFAVYVEVKRAKGKATHEQLLVHDDLRHAGAFVIVADSIDSFIFQFNETRKQIDRILTKG